MLQRKYHLERRTFWRFFSKPPRSRAYLAPGRHFSWARLWYSFALEFRLEVWDEECRLHVGYVIPWTEELGALWSEDGSGAPANVFLDAFCERPEVPETFRVIVANIRWDKSY